MKPSNGDRTADGIDVSLGDGVLECSARGHVTREIQLGACRGITDLLRGANGPSLLLWDALAVDGFDPGLPMALTRFFIGQVRHFSRVAVVARNPTILAVARAARMLIPPIPYAVFATRRDALAFLRMDAPRGQASGEI